GESGQHLPPLGGAGPAPAGEGLVRRPHRSVDLGRARQRDLRVHPAVDRIDVLVHATRSGRDSFGADSKVHRGPGDIDCLTGHGFITRLLPRRRPDNVILVIYVAQLTQYYGLESSASSKIGKTAGPSTQPL